MKIGAAFLFKRHIDDRFRGMPPLIAPEGTAYVFSESGALYALRQTE